MKYTTMRTTKGERTSLLVGWQTEAVFVGPGHAALAERVAELLKLSTEYLWRGE